MKIDGDKVQLPLALGRTLLELDAGLQLCLKSCLALLIVVHQLLVLKHHILANYLPVGHQLMVTTYGPCVCMCCKYTFEEGNLLFKFQDFCSANRCTFCYNLWGKFQTQCIKLFLTCIHALGYHSDGSNAKRNLHGLLNLGNRQIHCSSGRLTPVRELY